MPTQIHWTEGLHLQQHHLQQSQKLFIDSLVNERQLTHAYPYGVLEAKLKQAALNARSVQFERLRVIMPSGVEVDFPDAANLDPLDVARSFQELADATDELLVYLAVPLWQNERANSSGFDRPEGAAANLIYGVHQVQVPDENTGKKMRWIQIRRINARLLLEKDNPGMETMLLLQLKRSYAAGGVPEHAYCGPILTLKGDPDLYNQVENLAADVKLSRETVVKQLRKKGQKLELTRNREDLERFLGLQVVSRFAARLPALIRTPSVSPFEVCLALHELLAELQALHPERDFAEPMRYNHDDPRPILEALCASITELLPGGMAPKYFHEIFDLLPPDRFSVAIEEYKREKTHNYYLAVEAVGSAEEVARLVADGEKFKLVPKGKEDYMEGVLLKEEKNQPIELPNIQGLSYFYIDWAHHESAYIEFQKTGAMSIVSEAAMDFGYKCYMFMTLREAAKTELKYFRRHSQRPS